MKSTTVRRLEYAAAAAPSATDRKKTDIRANNNIRPTVINNRNRTRRDRTTIAARREDNCVTIRESSRRPAATIAVPL